MSKVLLEEQTKMLSPVESRKSERVFAARMESGLAVLRKSLLPADSMKTNILASLLAVTLLAGCPATDKKPAKARGNNSSLPGRDVPGDISFQAFVGRLKIAVASRDRNTLAEMMAPDFGYRWDQAPEGETPFSYWDEQKLWGRLGALVSLPWSEHDGYMVVPPELTRTEGYDGYRAGIAQMDGSWRFAYFVPAPPQQP